MRASRADIFETAADLSRWPEFLPHYRYIRYYERSPERNVVKMAAVRSGIPISWVSEQWIDRERCEVRFRHLKGVHERNGRRLELSRRLQDGVRVTILHDLDFRVPRSGAVGGADHRRIFHRAHRRADPRLHEETLEKNRNERTPEGIE